MPTRPCRSCAITWRTPRRSPRSWRRRSGARGDPPRGPLELEGHRRRRGQQAVAQGDYAPAQPPSVRTRDPEVVVAAGGIAVQAPEIIGAQHAEGRGDRRRVAGEFDAVDGDQVGALAELPFM